jgi:hypothetical protein
MIRSLVLAACVSTSALLAVRAESPPPSGPQIRVENMTKLPGTDIGFPADDWYVFNRLRTDLNPRNPGHRYSYDNEETIRVHNAGTATLELTGLELSDPAIFALRNRDFELLPIKIEPGAHYDLRVQFVKSEAFEKSAKGVYFSDLTIKSNAGQKKVTLAGHYQLRPEGANEPSTSDIMKLFGFKVGVPSDKHTVEYPTVPPKPGSAYGEIVVSDYWEQADPTKPVVAMVLYALGGGGDPNLKLVDAKDATVSGFAFKSPGRRQILGEEVWVCQTVFPPDADNPQQAVGKRVDRIDRPFRLVISGRPSSGGGPINPATGKHTSLALRLFRARDRDGVIRNPNDYLLCFDVTSQHGSHANSDFNDYVMYVSNIRPKDNRPEIDWTKK